MRGVGQRRFRGPLHQKCYITPCVSGSRLRPSFPGPARSYKPPKPSLTITKSVQVRAFRILNPIRSGAQLGYDTELLETASAVSDSFTEAVVEAFYTPCSSFVDLRLGLGEFLP